MSNANELELTTTTTTTSGSTFTKGAKVLCFHGPLLYEAKVESWKDSPKSNSDSNFYFVHYKGWKTKWDEWVPEDRLVKFNQEGMNRAKELRQKHAKVALGEGRKRRQSLDNVGDDSEASEVVVEQEVQDPEIIPKDKKVPSKPKELRSVSINLSNQIRLKLVQDWDLVSKKQCLYSLPVKVTISMVMEKFLRLNPGEKFLSEFCYGMMNFFNAILGRILLYRFERHQLLELCKKTPNFIPTDYYGPEHLSRLLLKLPIYLGDSAVYSHCSPSCLRQFSTAAKKLVEFLGKDFDNLFVSRVIAADSDYISRSKAS